MSIAAMARLIAREMLGSRQQARGPSPLELLSEETVLGAMRGEGRAEGRTAAGYLYHTARRKLTLVSPTRLASSSAAASSVAL